MVRFEPEVAETAAASCTLLGYTSEREIAERLVGEIERLLAAGECDRVFPADVGGSLQGAQGSRYHALRREADQPHREEPLALRSRHRGLRPAESPGPRPAVMPRDEQKRLPSPIRR